MSWSYDFNGSDLQKFSGTDFQGAIDQWSRQVEQFFARPFAVFAVLFGVLAVVFSILFFIFRLHCH